MEIINAVGRRKSAVARIFLKKGTGIMKVNKRDFTEYFPIEAMQILVKQPLEKTALTTQYDVHVNVSGGGISGQAAAIRLGIARALCKESTTNRPVLKKEGFLTRDARVVERKKYGHRKARKRFQFKKR